MRTRRRHHFRFSEEKQAEFFGRAGDDRHLSDLAGEIDDCAPVLVARVKATDLRTDFASSSLCTVCLPSTTLSRLIFDEPE